jgi:hypothetical protein
LIVVVQEKNFERKKTHSLRIVSGFFLLINDDSFNALGLLKKYFTQNCIRHKWLIESTKLRLTDQFKQNWHSTLQISPKALSYRLFKSNFRFEKYLDVLNDKNRFTFCRFRTSKINFGQNDKNFNLTVTYVYSEGIYQFRHIYILVLKFPD